MPTLLVAEHDNASLKDATAKALTAAKALGAEVHCSPMRRLTATCSPSRPRP
jgi:hypothetical protein